MKWLRRATGAALSAGRPASRHAASSSRHGSHIATPISLWSIAKSSVIARTANALKLSLTESSRALPFCQPPRYTGANAGSRFVMPTCAERRREREVSEREVQTQTDYKGQGWEGVNALISGESKTSSDLGRMRQIITRLKHNKPAGSPSGMFSS